MKMMRAMVGLVLLLGAVAWLGAGEMRDEHAGAMVAKVQAGPVAGVRFVPVDVVVDCGEHLLGSYQMDVTLPAGVKIVGLEGGDGVFAAAPYYDPAALRGDHVVVAAFSTEARLPAGKVRVARLHLMVEGPGAGNAALENAGLEKMATKLKVATNGAGRTIAATLTLRVIPNEGDRR